MKPESSAVLGRRDQLLFTPETAQRYTSLAALEQRPRTTADLLPYQRED